MDKRKERNKGEKLFESQEKKGNFRERCPLKNLLQKKNDAIEFRFME